MEPNFIITTRKGRRMLVNLAYVEEITEGEHPEPGVCMKIAGNHFMSDTTFDEILAIFGTK
jgi:hypothetical protein